MAKSPVPHARWWEIIEGGSRVRDHRPHHRRRGAAAAARPRRRRPLARRRRRRPRPLLRRQPARLSDRLRRARVRGRHRNPALPRRLARDSGGEPCRLGRGAGAPGASRPAVAPARRRAAPLQRGARRLRVRPLDRDRQPLARGAPRRRGPALVAPRPSRRAGNPARCACGRPYDCADGAVGGGGAARAAAAQAVAHPPGPRRAPRRRRPARSPGRARRLRDRPRPRLCGCIGHHRRRDRGGGVCRLPRRRARPAGAPAPRWVRVRRLAAGLALRGHRRQGGAPRRCRRARAVLRVWNRRLRARPHERGAGRGGNARGRLARDRIPRGHPSRRRRRRHRRTRRRGRGERAGRDRRRHRRRQGDPTSRLRARCADARARCQRRLRPDRGAPRVTTSPYRLPLAFPRVSRAQEERALGGVAAGIAKSLDVDPTLVRLTFALLAFADGAGIAAYLGAWLALSPEDGPAPSPRRRARCAALISVGGLLALRGFGVSDSLLWPLALGAAAFMLIRSRGGVYVVVGVVLGIAAVIAFVDRNVGQADTSSALESSAVAIALLLVLGPWAWRLALERDAERTARIRTEERAEMAARIHDSVLQTLALVQREAGDPRRVAALARRQERELRGWLYPASRAEGA